MTFNEKQLLSIIADLHTVIRLATKGTEKEAEIDQNLTDQMKQLKEILGA